MSRMCQGVISECLGISEGVLGVLEGVKRARGVSGSMSSSILGSHQKYKVRSYCKSRKNLKMVKWG